MEQFFQLLVWTVFLIPGSGEILLFGLGILYFLRPKFGPWFTRISRALFFAFTSGGVIWLIINAATGFYAPLKLVPYPIVAGLIWYSLKSKNESLQKLNLPLAIILFGLLNWQFSYSIKHVTTPASWKHDQARIEFKFSGGCIELNDNETEILQYLQKKNNPKVVLILRAIYHFGRFVGYNIAAFDGLAMKYSYSSAISSSYCKQTGTPVIPGLHLGIRGINPIIWRPNVGTGVWF
jgi:hypothetical protein